ncbi:MAG: hypothetical protein AABM40_04430 [Chloroflexota bacterium]
MIGGIVGAAASLVIVYGLPIGLALARGTVRPTFSKWRVAGALVVLMGTLFLGGLAAVLIGTDFKTALIAGLAYQSTLAGIAKIAGA